MHLWNLLQQNRFHPLHTDRGLVSYFTIVLDSHEYSLRKKKTKLNLDPDREQGR